MSIEPKISSAPRAALLKAANTDFRGFEKKAGDLSFKQSMGLKVRTHQLVKTQLIETVVAVG